MRQQIVLCSPMPHDLRHPHPYSRHLLCSCPAPSIPPHHLRPTPPSLAHRLDSIHRHLLLQMTIHRTIRILLTISKAKGTIMATMNLSSSIVALARALSERLVVDLTTSRPNSPRPVLFLRKRLYPLPQMAQNLWRRPYVPLSKSIPVVPLKVHQPSQVVRPSVRSAARYLPLFPTPLLQLPTNH
jgi:hypothetical protein